MPKRISDENLVGVQDETVSKAPRIEDKLDGEELKKPAASEQPEKKAERDTSVIIVSPTPMKQERNWRYIRELGSGSYSRVFLYEDNVTQERMAVKKQSSKESGNLERHCMISSVILREIEALNMLYECPHIIPMYEAFSEDHSVYIVMKYVRLTLSDMIFDEKLSFRETRIKHLMRQLFRAVAYAHERNFVHRDIKPANIVVDPDNKDHLYLLDWGLSRVIEPHTRVPMTGLVVTQGYRCPELLLSSSSYTNAVDMWSVGAVMAEMYLRNFFMFNARAQESEMEMLGRIFSKLGSPTAEEWATLPSRGVKFPDHPKVPMKEVVPEICDDGADLLGKLLSYDPTKRISARDALKHPFLKI